MNESTKITIEYALDGCIAGGISNIFSSFLNIPIFSIKGLLILLIIGMLAVMISKFIESKAIKQN